MKKAKLEILGIEVPLSWLDVFHDDGYVESAEEHHKALIVRYGGIFQLAAYGPEYFMEDSPGAYVSFDGLLRRHYHIFYERTRYPEFDISCRAHEETHFLEDFGRLDLLADKILKEQGVRVDFDKVPLKQVRAEIGAIYAILARGINPESLVEPAKRYYCYSQLQDALKWFERFKSQNVDSN